ncbi:serine--tRNA synthetase-like protein Slimp [Tribolium castaneum]|uniref:serine--tRNA synthetase-like protein Slimp n=1 Tax=Tribolium castaneum TaxID=7070 RepID=UPI00046C3C0C|nr:PREDICTED: serine--tRNA ligase, mitochondrial isoform X1 [Tribolium castaneum]|eukprot:XP_975414.2 PREDICTED: serine--tRNA ligase, mitochondrial isoform X1 [Tribolium castaneum]
MARLVQVFTKTVRRFSSALYVTGDKAQHHFVVLTPFVDFDEILKNKNDLIKSIEARKLTINLDKIEQRWNFFKTIDDHKTVLEFTRSEIQNLINKLKQDGEEKNQSDIEKLLLHIKVVKDDLKNVKEFTYGLEENANLGVLSLPNFLHPKTPLDSQTIIHEFLEQPKPIQENHLQIAKSQNLIEYTSPTLCYLKSDAALFEFAITNYFQSNLVSQSFTQFSNADFVRSLVVEGCGTDYLDKNKIFTLDGSNNEINRLHLVGGASLYSFMAYFAKNSIQSALLPLKFFTLGRKYSPGSGPDLLNLSQNTVGQIFVATSNNSNEIFDSLVQQIREIYEPLNYHFRLVYAPAVDLKVGESLKVSIEMFSNYSGTYVEVGYLSLYGDYISKRLLFTHGKERKFVNVISGEILNVQRFLACALENSYNHKSLLPSLLQKYL